MKYIFVSDIHGNFEQLEKCIDIFYKEEANKLVLLGDTSAYMGDDANNLIADKLRDMKRSVIVIRGNCDTSDFEEKLQFEIFDMDKLYISGKFVTITHGHYYNCYNLPYDCGDIFIQGHTHIPMLIKQNNKILANPGSVSKPRGCDLRCYIVLDNEKIVLKTLEGSVIKEIELKELI